MTRVRIQRDRELEQTTVWFEKKRQMCTSTTCHNFSKLLNEHFNNFFFSFVSHQLKQLLVLVCSGYLICFVFLYVISTGVLNGENFISNAVCALFFFKILFSDLCLRGELSITAAFIRLRSTQIWFDTLKWNIFLVILFTIFFFFFSVLLLFRMNCHWNKCVCFFFACAVKLYIQ